MKRAFKRVKIGIFILLVSAMVVHLRAEDGKFMVTLTGNLLVSSDTDFKEIYGNGNFCPEIKAAYKIYGDFYLWAGYSFLSIKGTIPVIEEEARSKQSFLSIGTGFYGKVISDLAYKAEIGVVYMSYKEEAMETEVNGSALGFRIEGALLYPVIKNLFAEATFGYMYGSDKINDISIKFGGLKTGIGLTIKF